LPRALLHQTIESSYEKNAKGTTKAEFEDLMRIIIPLAREAMAQYGFKARFSYDNRQDPEVC
jgi:hypothetical protein